VESVNKPSTSILTTSRHRGEAVQNFELFSKAWHECKELQVQTHDAWATRALLALRELERFEIAAHTYDRVVGGVILAHDPWDAHVGPCMSVFAQYVLPEFRLIGISARLMRESIRIARQHGVAVLAFTHRKAPWKYETIYRSIK